MTAAAIAKILSGALIVLRALSETFGVAKGKLSALISTAINENRDIGADEVQALIDDAGAALDDLDAAIEAAETEGEFEE